ncbi:hypothetical protein QOT17_015989 [Balamuthia mandrillaris]
MFLCDSVVDLVIQTFLFTLPLVVLPVALAWSFHLTLRLSLIFCLFHAIVALIKRLIPSLMVNVKPLLWLLEGLTLFALLFFVQPYLPLWLEIAYHYSLHYAGPAVLLLESVQVVCIVALFNQVISSKIEENPTLMKSILSAITLTCFIVAIYWVTILFQGELSIAFASYLSVTCTILIVLIILNICIEEGIISDIAIISLFVIYTTRNAALTNNISTITPFEFDSSYLFTLDFIFSVLLAIITIFTLPLTISSLWESDQVCFYFIINL